MLVLQNIGSAASSASLSTFHVRRPRKCWREFSFWREKFLHFILYRKSYKTFLLLLATLLPFQMVHNFGDFEMLVIFNTFKMAPRTLKIL